MRPALADRLCRVLVGCYPPRWKQRYADELLDVLDQHRSGRRTVLSLAGGPPWNGTSSLWDVTGQAQPVLWNVTRPRRPVREAVLSAGFSGSLWGEAFSPDGRILAAASTSGLVLWNVADPARARRIATLTGPRDYFTALAFSPDASLLAGVTYYHGSVRVFRLTGPPRVTTRPDILARALFPGGKRTPTPACAPGCDVTAAYALGFTPVFTWQVASSGALSDLTTFFRDVSDTQPTLVPGNRIVADGAILGGGVHLWTLP